MRLPDIAQKLDIPEETLNILNAELRHRITPDKPYKLRVPTEMTGQLLTVIDEIPQADKPREIVSEEAGCSHQSQGATGRNACLHCQQIQNDRRSDQVREPSVEKGSGGGGSAVDCPHPEFHRWFREGPKIGNDRQA